MLNFTVGPVMSFESVLTMGSNSTPYFRTDEFAEIMLKNEEYMLEFSEAPKGSRAIFMTCSSSGSMEATVINCFSQKDKLLVVNGGTFGQRFVDICMVHHIPYQELKLKFGEALTQSHLDLYNDAGFTGLLVNINETSSGTLYDGEMLGSFCRRNNMLYVCDCVSSFLTDPFHMEEWGADVMITGSQKALACPPGISIIVLSLEAIDKVESTRVDTLYFNLKAMLSKQLNGQTPFTPAVSVLLQINRRLEDIRTNGGVQSELTRVATLAADFRNKILGMPFEIRTESAATGVTALYPLTANAYDIVQILKNKYQIWVCPNSMETRDTVFRVGHMGALTVENNTTLINALKDMQVKGLI